MLTSIVLFAVYVILVVILVLQIIRLTKAGLREVKRMTAAFILFFILLFVTIFPNGIFDFEKIVEGEDLLVAEREGSQIVRLT
jgi:hypothetical protein